MNPLFNAQNSSCQSKDAFSQKPSATQADRCLFDRPTTRPLPVRDNLNKYVYSTTRIGNIWYMEPGLARAEIVYFLPYRHA